MADPIHGVEAQDKNTTLLMVNVDGKFVGLSLTESNGPFDMRRIGLELHDVKVIELIRDFCIQQIERMSK